ncbi:UpxY family transcription antiterminator [Kordia jejudonensis]|uniref:UpxY family transcription antiterminator n=1 Tax=Kordia jejudonensis TaxID=1348245 RepID=UPI0006299360|nr:UpxY family transcription antiterminator [Kordia jejudonensis]
MEKQSCWYVLYVRSRHEKKVCNLLNEKSIEAFLPEVKTIRKWSDRKKMIMKPLFPSYVFVNIKSPSEFHDALSTYGACAYIRFGKEYAKVPGNIIDKIKLLVNVDGVTDIETNVQLPKIGDIKKITMGALSGLDCEILKVDNAKKIIVRIDSLRQNITATIPSYFLSQQTLNAS